MKIKSGHVVVLVLILSVGLIFMKLRNKEFVEPREILRQKFKTGACPGPLQLLKMNDTTMTGIFELGQKLELLPNWYACKPIHRGESVYYQFTSTHDPVVRVVAAVPGDRFKIVENSLHQAWSIEINGELYQAGGAPYYFGRAGVRPALSLYEKNGALGAEEVILFSNLPPGGNDSGIFGIASIDDLLGRVQAIPVERH